jgi:dTDP-4-amino-4,6-dideoxygalactose transaminase
MSKPSTPVPEYIPLARPAIGDRDIEAVLDVLRSGWLTTGPRVHDFEAAFARYVGARHAIAVNSCTAALHLSLLTAGIGPGDEVVTTPLTFCSTVNVILHVGAMPVFADIDPVTHNLDPSAAEAAVTASTTALLPVHYSGRPAAMSAFRDMAERRGLRIVEDAAHCIEGVSDAGKVGGTGDFTCFSFYATKNVSTGEGGMVTTAKDDWAGQLRVAALHGMSRNAWARYEKSSSAHYDVVLPGFKYNMTDIQAALGLQQLSRIEELGARRQAVWSIYDEGLADVPLRRPAPVPAGQVHARHIYAVLVDEQESGWTRDEFASALAEDGIGTSVHFRAVHLFSYYANRFGFRRGMFPNAEHVSEHTLSLPLSGSMTPSDAQRVVDAVRRRMKRTSRRRR